jgi:NUMOD3 motif
MARVGKYERTPEIRKKLSDAAKQRTGRKNSFFNKTHSEESKQKMSRAKVGLTLTVDQRAERKAKHTAEWIAAHPKKVKEYDQRYLERRALNNRRRRQKLRMEVIAQYGSRCASPTCRWQNEDGTLGCTDARLLQLDHKAGGGTQERGKMGVEAMWKKAQQDTSDAYQLLCSNCNWLKAHIKREFRIKYEGEEEC